MHLLGRYQGEAFVEVKTCLVTKDAFGASSGAIGFENTLGVHVAQKIFVLSLNQVIGHFLSGN